MINIYFASFKNNISIVAFKCCVVGLDMSRT